jgi:glycosyltransferase involved in cell wall biosynthesis
LKALDYVNLCYIWYKSYLELRKIWSGHRKKHNTVVRVNYGFATVPGPDKYVFGGLVKLQDLNKEFPHCTVRPDILYLVSSALPYFPVRLARMARKSGAKIVINQNGTAYPGWFGKGWQRQNRPMARLHSMADYVFYQSEFCRISAERFLDGQRSLPSEILYNSVDTHIFSPTSDASSAKDAVVLLLSGSHWTRYRVDVALETLRTVRLHDDRVHLKIAGRFCWRDNEDQAENEVRSYAEQLGIVDYVTLNGPYTQEQAPALLNSCSILLHTKYNDPCPRLVVEAMACGLPVVYSATGGVPELVGEEGGRGIAGPLDWANDHPPDAASLAEAVLEVLQNLPGYSAAARQRAIVLFDQKHWINRHSEIFSSLC